MSDRYAPLFDTRRWADAELVATVLGYEGATRDAVRLLETVGGLGRLARGEAPSGFPVQDAERLRAAIEIGRRAVARPFHRGAKICSAHDVYAHLGPLLASLEQEELHLLGLDGRSRLLLHTVVAIGSANQVAAHPRDIFRPALRAGAEAVVIVHNHPGGSSDPSRADEELTRRLSEAGALLCLPLFDHVIIAHQNYFSFAEAGGLGGIKKKGLIERLIAANSTIDFV